MYCSRSRVSHSFCLKVEKKKKFFFLRFSCRQPQIPPHQINTTAGPVYLSEAPLAFASITAEDGGGPFSMTERGVSFSNAFQANSSSPTDHGRYLPRVITCVIRANDPGNNGLPVYATGQYLAIANSSFPFGIELRPNFSFPL